jgi:hypothetical protein
MDGGVHGAMVARGAYRYLLTRRWGDGAAALFVMLNPSTADDAHDDPTLRRCIGFARRWRLDGVEVVNLYALRATDPRDLFAARAPVGPDNDAAIAAAAARAALIVVAWGAHGERDPDRVARVVELLRAHRLACLGVNRGGTPRHPLYVPRAIRRRAWTPSARARS